MKKLLLTSIIYLSVTAATTISAQSNPTTANDKMIAFKSTPLPESSGTMGSFKTDVTDRALKNFKKYFADASDDVWVKSPNGYVVRFTSNGIPNTAFLSNHGNCQSCIRYYTEKELPGDIRQRIKSTYYDFSITSVREVTYNSQTAYLVTIEDKTSWKVIRIVDGEMDVWEEHAKG